MIKVPFIPSPRKVVEEALRLACVGRNDVLYDLGAGDGRVVLAAARRGARCVAVEIDDALATTISLRALEEGLASRITVLNTDFFHVDLSPATVVYQYLYPSVSEKLSPLYEKMLRPGARIIALDLGIPGWIPVRIHRMFDEAGVLRTIYIYLVGFSNPGSWRVDTRVIPPSIVAGIMGLANCNREAEDMG